MTRRVNESVSFWWLKAQPKSQRADDETSEKETETTRARLEVPIGLKAVTATKVKHM